MLSRSQYWQRGPSQKPRSFAPSDKPCERFSLLGTYATSAIQPTGLIPRGELWVHTATACPRDHKRARLVE